MGEVTPWWPIEEHLLKLSREQLLKYKAYIGHYGWFLPDLVRTPLRVMTVLRDPMDRTFSHFHDLRTSPQDWLYKVIADNKWTFEDFVCSDLGKGELTNFMTRHIAFDDIQQDFWNHSPMRDSDLRGLLDKYSDDMLLDISLQRLESCDLVGLFERFSETLQLAAHKLSWTPTWHFRKHNKTRGTRSDDEMTHRAKEVIASITKIDQKLYDWAVKRFEDEMQNLSSHAIEESYWHHMQTLPRVASITWNFERPINGAGWSERQWYTSLHPREKEDIARVACHDGPTWVDVPLRQGSTYEIRFFARKLIAKHPHPVTLKVNDVAIPLRTWQSRFDTHDDSVWSGIAPADVIVKNPAFTRVQFEREADECLSQSTKRGLLAKLGFDKRESTEDITSTNDVSEGFEMRWLEIIPVS